MMKPTVPTSVTRISIRFRFFNKDINDIWESYNLVEHYMKDVHKLIKADKMETLTLKNIIIGDTKKYSKQDTFGAISHLIKKANPRRALIDSIAIFEHFLTYLVYVVYMDYQGRLLTGNQAESAERDTKLMDIIINSNDKDEMIEKIVEEKVRAIFYGNPLDFFVRDKAKLGFGDYFKLNRRDELEKYKEITARRNVYAHNNGMVDRKYLREVTSPKYPLGSVIPIDSEYLRESIHILKVLGASATALVLWNIYKEIPKGNIARLSK